MAGQESENDGCRRQQKPDAKQIVPVVPGRLSRHLQPYRLPRPRSNPATPGPGRVGYQMLRFSDRPLHRPQPQAPEPVGLRPIGRRLP